MKTWYQKYNEQIAQDKVKAYRNDMEAMLKSLEKKTKQIERFKSFNGKNELTDAYRYACENFD